MRDGGDGEGRAFATDVLAELAPGRLEDRVIGRGHLGADVLDLGRVPVMREVEAGQGVALGHGEQVAEVGGDGGVAAVGRHAR